MKIELTTNDLIIKDINEIIKNICTNKHILKRQDISNAAKRKYIYLETENDKEIAIITAMTIQKSELNNKYLNKCHEKHKSPILNYIKETFKYPF